MIIALHGFLGLSSDWTAFDGAFTNRAGLVQTLRKWDLYSDLPEQPPQGPESPLRTWAREFCARLRSGARRFAHETQPKPILMGYSLGGRLALHALLEDASLFSAAVIVAAHPGLTSPDLKLQRRMNDARWAERFRHEEWSALMGAWGEQEVFRNPDPDDGAIALRRLEVDFNRTQLARAMLAWSLSEQDDLRLELADLRLPVLWVTGQQDRRFSSVIGDMMMDLVDSPAHRWAQVPHAGHRVPWDNPAGFVAEVQEFINQVL